MTATRTAAARVGPATESPYVGLDYFIEEKADLFFGRDAERRMIIGNLRASRLTLLYAESGVGKSSLLRAGVAARLSELARQSSAERGTPRYVPVVFSTWRDDPVADLIDAIEKAMRPFLPNGSGLELPCDTLEGAIGSAGAAVNATPLVILDQFEDYFLYHRQDEAGERFADGLAACLRRRDLKANFLLSIRQDAYSRIGDRFKTRIPNVYGNYLHLDYLGERAARDAIRQPLEQLNRRLDGAGGFVIEDELVDEVLHQVRRGQIVAGDGDRPEGVETAYLQLVMERLWVEEMEAGSRKLRLETLERLGGAETIIRMHLHDAMRELPDDEREAAAGAFRYLVTSAGTKIALTPGELSEFASVPEATLRPALDHLKDERILRPVGLPMSDSGEVVDQDSRYELFHDVLGKAVLDWRAAYEAEREKATLVLELEEEKQRRLAEAERLHQEQHNVLLRRALAGMGVLVLALIGAVAWALFERGVAQEERERARSEALAASAIGKLSVDPELSVMLAREAWDTHETEQADDALRRSLAASRVRDRFAVGPILGADSDAAAEVLATVGTRGLALWRPADRPRLLLRHEPPGDVALARLAASGAAIGVGSNIATEVLRAESGGDAVRLRGAEGLYSLALSHDGTYAAGVDRRGIARVWNARSGRRLARFPSIGIVGLDFDPTDPRHLIAGDCQGQQLQSWRWRANRVETLQAGRRAAPSATAAQQDMTDPFAGCFISVSPDGKRAVQTHGTGSAGLWDLERGRLVQPQMGNDETVAQVKWSRSGRRVATASGKTATVFDGRTGEFLSRPTGHTDFTNTVAFSPDERSIATTSRDGTARVWDVASAALMVELRGHGDNVVHAAFMPGGRHLVTVSADGSARVWAVDAGRTLRGHSDWVLDAAFCPEGGRVATAGDDGVARVWTVADGSSVRVRGGYLPSRTVNSVAFDAGCERVVTAGDDTSTTGQILVADADTGEVEQELLPGEPVHHAAFSPDGKWLLTNAAFGKTSLWKLSEDDTPKVSLRLPTAGTAITANFSPSGRSIVTAGIDGVARIFDRRTRKQRVAYRRPGVLYGATFSPDGRRVLSHGSDTTAQIWDARTGRELVVLRGHTSWVSSAVFSPSGSRVVTGSADQTTRVWDARTGKLLSTQRMHGDSVNSVAFAPDGRTILSASDDRTARLYACATCDDTEDLVDDSRGRVFRPFTEEERREFLESE